MKLFWKEIRDDLIPVHIGKTIWDEIPTAIIDTQKLEHLFESRAKDTISKVQKMLHSFKQKKIFFFGNKMRTFNGVFNSTPYKILWEFLEHGAFFPNFYMRTHKMCTRLITVTTFTQ